MDLAKNFIPKSPLPESSDTGELTLTEPELKKLAHLPLLTFFYLLFQKRFSSTPVTALELAAYLGVDVQLGEVLMSHLEKKGIVRVFKEGIAAYSLMKDVDQVNVKDLIEMVGDVHLWVKKNGELKSAAMPEESSEKYRKIYSDLAREMLQLFGEEAVNKLPL